MKDKKIACYPAYISFLVRGKYRISDLQKIEGIGMVARLAPEKIGRRPLIIKGAAARGQLSSAGYCIEMDDDYWEILFPYLRLDTAVVVH